MTTYGGYWPQADEYARYVLVFLDAALIVLLALVSAAALVRSGDERVAPQGVRRGRGSQRHRARDISMPDAVGALCSRVADSSTVGVSFAAQQATGRGALRAVSAPSSLSPSRRTGEYQGAGGAAGPARNPVA